MERLGKMRTLAAILVVLAVTILRVAVTQAYRFAQTGTAQGELVLILFPSVSIAPQSLSGNSDQLCKARYREGWLEVKLAVALLDFERHNTRFTV